MIKLFDKKRGQKGFTLVELMVVVVIIGILVAIAIPIYGGIQERARNNSCQANMRTIAGAGSIYYSEIGTDAATIAALVAADYLNETPVCPWPNPAAYTYSSADGVVSVTCTTADCGAVGINP